MPLPFARRLSPHAFVLGLVALGACDKGEVQTITIPTEAIARRNIVVDATASGAIEPINVVEVKSKSSGQITQMTVETGSRVRAGELLVQLETRDVQNQYDQAKADLNAAEARLQVSEAQKKRADDLFRQRITTAQENEAATIDYANAQAAVIRARTSLDLAQQRLDDATVKAPGQGTIIEKTVSLGQVITSATSAMGGGTTLLKMADLTRVRMRALFNETDIGSVRPGQPATVRVDAYPDRPFRGNVEKIEPQAVVQQSVTMFPVLITLPNETGLLKPGMNGEASVLVEERINVLAVPNDAVRTTREAPMLAGALGLTADSVQAEIQSQMAASMGGAGFGEGGGRREPVEAGLNIQGPPRGMRMMPGEVDLGAPVAQQGAQGGGRPQGGGNLPQVSDQDCAKVRDVMAAKPDVTRQLQALFPRVQRGEIDFDAMRAESAKLYAALGVDANVARACQRRDGAGAGRGGPGTGNPTQRPLDSTAAGAPQQRTGATTGRPATQGAPVPEQRGEFPARTRTRLGVVFVSANGAFSPKVVRLGLGNFDYTEVVSGLKEGDEVAMLAAVALQVGRDSSNARFRQMTGGGVPGMSKNTPAAPSAGAGGRPPSGGGGAPRP